MATDADLEPTLPDLTLEDFSGLVNHTFPLEGLDAPFALALVEARPVAGGLPGGRQPFALLFRGPRTPLLSQAMYRVRHPSRGLLALFVVPVAATADGVDYEAVFG